MTFSIKHNRLDVLIVGSGVVGLSLAWELSRHGKRVRVIEADVIAGGASWAGAGILPPAAKRGAVEAYEQLKSLSHELHSQWAQRLLLETGIDNGYRRCGGVYLASSPAEAATLAANRLWWEDYGIEYQPWSAQQLFEREPGLARRDTAQLATSWFLPDECQLRNPRHLKALVAACQKNGVELTPHCPLDELLINNGRVTGLVAGGTTMAASQVCVCSGAWARTTLAELGFQCGIMPVRGQMVLYRCPRPLINCVVNDGNRYLVPREDGRTLAGSVEEEVGYVVETTASAIGQIRRWAENALPELAACQVERCWAGLRPGSYDGFPYLGKVPGLENLFVAAGHFRSGLHLSCGTAVVMADEMLGKPRTIDLNSFRVGRG